MYLEGVADLTGDGKPDAYGYELQANNTYKNIVILPNNGSGGFGDPMIINTAFLIEGNSRRLSGLTFNAISPSDLNGDGKIDFVVLADTVPSVVFTYLNNGKGGFTQSSPTIIEDTEYIHTMADINTDGRPDLITVRFIPSSPQRLAYRPANADGTYGAAVQLVAHVIPPVFADFNSDGKIDFAHSTWNGTGMFSQVFINLGGGIFSPLAAQDGSGADTQGYADFDGNGKPDVYGFNVGINNGAGVFTGVSLPYDPPVGLPTSFVYPEALYYASDYDGDGDKDIIRVEGGREEQVAIRKRYYSIHINNGSGVFTRNVIMRPYLGFPADINGDGKDEEVIFVNATNEAFRSSMTNETAVVVRSSTCTPVVQGQTKLIDFSGDGVSDIASWSPGTGKWSYWSAGLDASFTWGGGAFGDKPAPGDFDGDGKTDAAVFREPSGDWWIRKSSDGGYIGTHFGAAGDIPIPGDYDGDGKSDIAVFRPSDGNWYIWLSGNSQYLFLHFGAAGDIPIPADFDGDGKDNIAIFRPSGGDWFYLTSTFDNYVGVHWGAAGDIPIPADFDMDGKADITIYRPSDRYWYVFRSYDNGVTYVKYGDDPAVPAMAVVPMAVDNDGDGVMQVGIFRPSQLYCPTIGGPCSWSTGIWSSLALRDPWGNDRWGLYGGQNDVGLRLRLSN